MNANRLQINLLFLFAIIHWITVAHNTAVRCPQKDGRISEVSSRLYSMFLSIGNTQSRKQKLFPSIILCYLLEGQCYCLKILPVNWLTKALRKKKKWTLQILWKNTKQRSFTTLTPLLILKKQLGELIPFGFSSQNKCKGFVWISIIE